MNKVLYLGNKFYHYKRVNSVLETLEPLFSEFCNIKTASDKKNQVLRFLHMVFYFFRYGLKADKIIIDVYSTKAFYFAYIFAKFSLFFNKKYILFLHGGNLPDRFHRSPFMTKAIFKRAYRIIAPSFYLQSFFQDKGFKVIRIPNIIELVKYSFKLRKKVEPRLLALRGFGKPYNPLMTLKAVNELKIFIPDIQLLMMGNKEDYHYKEVINFIEKNHLQNIVTIQPKCTREEWVVLSQDYDIMISNPVIDNTPVSLIEGMALGMCIITTNVGGIPNLVSENECLLLESNDVAALTQGILYLIRQPDYACQLSINGRKKAEEFDWKIIKEKWMEVLT